MGGLTCFLGLGIWMALGSLPAEERRLLAVSHWIGAAVISAVALACFGMALSFCGLLLYCGREVEARLQPPRPDQRWPRLLPIDPSFRAATLGFVLNVLALLVFYRTFSL